MCCAKSKSSGVAAGKIYERGFFVPQRARDMCPEGGRHYKHGQILLLTRFARKVAQPILVKTQKLPKSQLFEFSLKSLEGFKNGKIMSWLRPDTQDHVPELLS